MTPGSFSQENKGNQSQTGRAEPKRPVFLLLLCVTHLTSARPSVTSLFSRACAVVMPTPSISAYWTAVISSPASSLSDGAILSYGDYADKSLLGRMAQSVRGFLTQANDIETIGETVKIVSGKKAARKRIVSVPRTARIAVAVEDGRVINLTIANGAVEAP